MNSSQCPIPLMILIVTVLVAACSPKPFTPVNEGREYGNPKTPFVVSHLPDKNKWAMYRTEPHHFFKQVLCFDYRCRKMIARRKGLRAISYEDFKKRIEKNARKGIYKRPATNTPPVKVQPKHDTTLILRDTAGVTVQQQPLPVLKADSLITLSGEFLFEVNSYKLQAAHFAQLDSLSQFLLSHPALEVKISGHTDNTGNERQNVTLSTRRAESVANYLIGKGVSVEKVFFEGYGSSQPIADNSTSQGRGKNRRVEILIKNAMDK